MTSATSPRILAVANGAPLDRLTWSGISFHFLTALARRGALATTVDGRSDVLERLEQAASYSRRSPLRWRQRYHANAAALSPAIRWARTAVTGVRARGVASDVDVALQIGVWYDTTRLPGLSGLLRCTYQDGNLMTFLERPDLVLDRESRSLRRAIAHEAGVQRRMDFVFTMSEWVRRSMIDDYGLDPRNVVTVGAGPNLDTLPPRPEREDGPPRLLFVGKRFDRKGGPQLLEAFRRVRARRPDAELWIVGPAEPVSTDAGVRHIGHILRDMPAGDAQIDRLYREASAFVLPSLYEPFGISFLEAMAYRLPCVGSDSCAMPEIIDHGVTGYVAPTGDAEGLGAVLLELIEEPRRMRAMGDAAYARLLERFTWDRVAERLLDALGDRLGR
jgi:glycosyltransferase involved in cell wall biosynthesis